MRVKLYSLFLATYEYLSGSLFGPQLILEPSDVAPASALATEAFAARPGKVITPEFDGFVKGLLHDWKQQGLAVAVVTSSSVEYGTYGLSTEEGDPVTKDTLFGIASCSKAFTSAALGALMEDFAAGKNTTALPPSISKLSWKTKVKDIIPGWELQDRFATDYATIQDLATHVTGMGRHDYSYSPTDTTRDIVQRLKLLKPAHELREQWSYNSQMYMVLSDVVARLAGKPFEEYVQERLFDPVGMKSTTYSTLKATHSGHMSHVWNSDGRRIPYAFPESAVSIVAPAGGIITNIVDLSRWAATLLNRGTSPCTKKETLKFATIDALTTATTIMEGKAPAVDGSVKGYAKGWWRYSYRGHEVIAHSGSGPGISAHVRILPHANVGVIVLGNQGPANPATHAVARRALEDALGQSRIPWPETPDTVVKATPLPVGSIPPISLAHYAGAYKNAAYGTLRLCERDDKSPECASTVKTFKTIECARARNSSVLYGEWPRLWSSHARLTHVKEHVFFNDLPSVFAAGYGKNATAFASSSGRDGRGVVMEFAVRDGRVEGLGLMEDVQVLVNGDKRPLRERADAWFERV